MPERITSRDNAKIKYACKLAQSAAFRNEEKAFLAEGLKLCPELAKGCPLKVIYYTDKALEKSPALARLPGEHYLVEPHVAEKLAQADPETYGQARDLLSQKSARAKKRRDETRAHEKNLRRGKPRKEKSK